MLLTQFQGVVPETDVVCSLMQDYSLSSPLQSDWPAHAIISSAAQITGVLGPLLAQEYICIGEFTPFLLELHTAVKGLLLFLYVCKRRRLHLDIFPAIIDFIFTLLEVCAMYE